MILIWWPALLLPALMVLCGLLGRFLPGRKYRSPVGLLSPERQRFADGLLLKLLWQVGLTFAALSLMVMRSVCLMAQGTQRILLYVLLVVEVAGNVALILPVERSLKAHFDEEESYDAD